MKKAELAHSGAKRTAHLWHTYDDESSRFGATDFDLEQLIPVCDGPLAPEQTDPGSV